MEQAIEGLMNLGLSEKEALTYFALVELSQASAQAVAQKSGLKRPTTYILLSELMKKGLVLKILKQRKQMFAAKSPRELLVSAEEKMRQAKDIFPVLEAAAKAPEKVRSLYFEGIEGIKEALYYRLAEMRGKHIQAFFGDSHEATPELNRLFHRWNDDVYKNGIQIKSIAPRSDFLSQFRKKDKVHGFPSKIVSTDLYASKCSIDITPLFVRVIFFKEQQALIIESLDAAVAMSEIFNMVFNKH